MRVPAHELTITPQLLQLSAAAEDPWLWALIEIAPVPAAASKLTRGRTERFVTNDGVAQRKAIDRA
ncbi:MAG: hypothetical protein JO061_18890 [Acidobacteriaceae bacterium]|nr:hypothetical protein [Acidobacteriaceae bacterium]